jgi:hypothetical protein
MLHMNLPVLALSAVVPFVIGIIWYSKYLFGSQWQKTQSESGSPTRLIVLFGLTYLLGFLASVSLQFIVIHQFHIASILAGEPDVSTTGSATQAVMMKFLVDYGDRFRTFGHGALHGVLTGLFLILPVIATHSLFEKKGFRYVAVHTSYWALCLALMGGIICQFT